MHQSVDGRIRGAEHLNIEPFKHGARQIFRLRQRSRDLIIDLHGRFSAQPFAHTQHFVEFVLQPHARGRSAKKIHMVGNDLPYPAMIGLGGAAVPARHAHGLQSYALRIEHAEQIVIRNDQQFSRIRKGCILSKQPGIDMAMGAKQRQILDRMIEMVGYFSLLGIRGKIALRM
ncbi:MAG: hypothetical protein BWY83_03323 [bacterium ADurb.Bin478]|nr:MAG: hypothetical protein BWY83_03323 [bacterium ADurb.Bin478]